MLWKILTVVLFWKVVFDFALADVKGMEKIVGGIKGAGESFGKFALSATGEQIKLPNPMGDRSITATDIGGMLLRGNRTLSAAATRMSQPGNDDEGMLGALRGASGATRRNDERLPELRRIQGQENARTHLLGQTQAAFLRDYRESNAAVQEQMRRIYREATGVNLDDADEAAVTTEVNQNAAVFSRGSDGRDGDARPPQQTVVTGTATLEGNITIDNRADDIALTQEITAGTAINQASLQAAGVTAAIVEDLDARQRAQLATQIATRAGVADQDTAILRIINAMN